MLPTLHALHLLSRVFKCLIFLWVAAMHGSMRARKLLLLTLLVILGLQFLLFLPFPVGASLMNGLVLSICLPAASALAVSTVMPVLPMLVLF